MFAQVEVPAHDYFDSDDNPTVTTFEFDDEELHEKGLKVVIGETVITFYPLRELAERMLSADVQVQEVQGNKGSR